MAFALPLIVVTRPFSLRLWTARATCRFPRWSRSAITDKGFASPGFRRFTQTAKLITQRSAKVSGNDLLLTDNKSIYLLPANHRS